MEKLNKNEIVTLLILVEKEYNECVVKSFNKFKAVQKVKVDNELIVIDKIRDKLIKMYREM